MNRAIRLTGITVLVCFVAVGGYFAGIQSERQRQATATVLTPHHQSIDITHSPASEAAGKSEDTVKVEQRPQSLQAMLADARQRLMGGMINIGSIVDVFESMGELDPTMMPEVMRIIEEMPNFQQKNLLYMAALTRWADQDGAAAADFVSKNFTAERKAGMLGAVFSSWAAKDPLTAWKWFDSNRESFANPASEHPLVRSLYQGLATKDFAAAMARLQTEEDFDLKTVALDALGVVAATTDQRDAFFQYARSLENSDQRLRAINSVLGHLAHSDPAEASTLVETLETGKERVEAAKQVANAWFESDPERSSAWFLGQVPADEMPAAIRDVTNRWLRRDPNAAAEFLSQTEQGAQTDPARAAFSQGIAAMDPESAITWAGTITDDKMREGSLVNVYKQWYRRDPGAAEASLNQSGLSEEQLQKVLE
ncbi:MAG: hypothetical protein R3F19_03780 [Verrucomicrobiales bacterium]